MNKADYNRTYKAEEYKWLKSHHVCPQCKHKKAAPKHVLCLECLSDISERNYQRRSKLTDEQRKAESQRATENKRKRKEHRKALNLCVECGKRPPKDGRVSCGICLHKHSERMKLYNRRKGRKPQELLLAHDVCWICGGEPLPGKRLCNVHYDIAMANLRKANQNRNNTNHIWKKLNYAGSKHEKQA